jgi:hypothetical protein
MKYNLISNPIVNYKASKNLDLKVMTYFLSLMPSDLSGYNVCSMANRITKNEKNPNKSDCSSNCVAFNGNGSFSNVKKARIRKTKLFFENKELFMEQLVFDIFKAINEAKTKGFKPTFRLNAYSDIKWEKVKISSFGNATIFELFPNITFYDYTKNLNRLVPSNYELTYSHWGNWKHTKSQIKNNLNIAMVFDKRHELPNKYNGLKVIDGDKTDLRTKENDGSNIIVGLRAKMSMKNIDLELKKEKSFVVVA